MSLSMEWEAFSLSLNFISPYLNWYYQGGDHLQEWLLFGDLLANSYEMT